MQAFVRAGWVHLIYGGGAGMCIVLPGLVQVHICTPLTLQHRICNYFMLSRLDPKPGLDRYFSNKGKTAYVYPAYELSLFLQALA